MASPDLYQIPDLSEPKIQEEIRQWMEQSKSLNIVVVGATGVGKSTLINDLLGLTSTTVVSPHKHTINGIEITIWDVIPGLHDVMGYKGDKIAEGCKKVDLLVYCNQMTDRRITFDTVDTIAKITRVFGEDVWKNAVYALTFANALQPRPGSSVTKPFFEEQLKAWRKVIPAVLSIPEETVNHVPIVPTSYRGCGLPDRPDWFTAFWIACYHQTKSEAQPALLKINQDRFARKEDVQEQDKTPLDPHQQPIVADRYKPEDMEKLVGVSVAIGSDATVASTAVGGGIGTLIGIVGGPIGMAIGTAIGAAVGGTVGGVSGTAFGTAIAFSITKFMRKKQNEEAKHRTN